MLALGIAGLLSLSISFWIFIKSDTNFLRGQSSNLRSNSENLDSDLDVAQSLVRMKSLSALYRAVSIDQCDPFYHDLLSSISSGLPHVMSEFIFVCYESDLPTLLQLLETDGTVAGSKIIWLFPVNASQARPTIQMENHIYLEPRNRLKPTHETVKELLLWDPSVSLAEIPKHEFCWFGKWEFRAFTDALAYGCVPISKKISTLPMGRFIRWDETAIIEPIPEKFYDRIHSLSAENKDLRRSLLSEVWERLNEFSDADFILLYLGLSYSNDEI